MTLNSTSEKGYPSLVPDIKGKTLSFFIKCDVSLKVFFTEVYYEV